jgi:hypothetical protein
MASAYPVKQDFSVSGDLEKFGYRFPGFDSFGASHAVSLSSAEQSILPRSARFERQMLRLFESLSGQLTHLISKFSGSSPQVGARKPIPLV